MPDRREHRGPHPEDRRLFGPEILPTLRRAAEDLSWLLARGYAGDASVTLVGDHFQLDRRQRVALRRSTGPDPEARRRKRVALAGARVAVDGFNQIVTVEAALSGGLLIRGTDGLLRDLASVHGSYRGVEETAQAVALLIEALRPAAEVRWILDRPVSNSGRLAAILREHGQDVSLEDAADHALLESGLALASSDGPLLDRAAAHVDLTGTVVAGLPGAWVTEWHAGFEKSRHAAREGPGGPPEDGSGA